MNLKQNVLLAIIVLFPFFVQANGGTRFQPLPPSGVILGKPDKHPSGQSDKKAYTSFITNHFYDVMGQYLFARSTKRYIQYLPLDAWPMDDSVVVYRIGQDGAKAGSLYDGYERPMRLANGGKPLLEVRVIGDGAQFTVVVAGKRFDLGDNTAPHDLSGALFISNEQYCCTSAGRAVYYRLDDGKKLFTAAWEDSGFVDNAAELVATSHKEWVLLSAQAKFSKNPQKLAVKLNSQRLEKEQSLNLDIALPKPLATICNDWCHLKIFSGKQIYPDKPERLPTISEYGETGGIFIEPFGQPRKSVPLAQFKLDGKGAIAELTCAAKMRCNSEKKISTASK